MENTDSELPRFECLQCGMCCSHIRGKMSKEEYALITQLGYGSLPMVQLAGPEKLSFPIWPDEARNLRRKTEELGLRLGKDVKILPLRVVFDLATNTAIVITYFFDHDDCPFQVIEGNGCVGNAGCAKCIAYESRTLICRQFPFQTPNDIVEWCCGIKKLNEKLAPLGKKSETLTAHEKKFIFGDAHSAALEMHERMTKAHKRILELIKEKKIRPAVNYPYHFLLRRIENSKTVDFEECG